MVLTLIIIVVILLLSNPIRAIMGNIEHAILPSILNHSIALAFLAIPSYCRFSHDVTKIQTTKPLILLIFYFNEV